jgi:hypothetical protein
MVPPLGRLCKHVNFKTGLQSCDLRIADYKAPLGSNDNGAYPFWMVGALAMYPFA